MKDKPLDRGDDLRAEYDFDFTKAERGRYYKRLLKEGSNVVVLEPDLAEVFPDSAAVNNALRSLVELARSSTGLTRRSARGAKKAPRTGSTG